MKSTYVFFGQKGYFYETDSGADQYINGNSAAVMVLADSGLVPADHTAGIANTSTSTDVYRILIKSDGTEGSDECGTNYTSFFYPTDGSITFVAKRPQAGGVIELNAAGWGAASSGQLTVVAYGGDGANGYDIQDDDKVWVEQVAAGDAAGNGFGGAGAAFAYPMSNFLGANPVTYNGEHWDGTALDQTDLRFISRDGTGTEDIIRLIHDAGRYPDICRTMIAIANCGVYDRAITFYDLDMNGNETFAGGPSLSGHNDLGIKGCWRTD